MRFIKILGSLYFAIFLIVTLATLLIISTFFESAYGTPFAHRVFYSARWFDVLLGLVGVNIFCSTVSRFPYQKHHIGFIVTHVGILLLLTGALLTRIRGVEGQMTLFESQTKNHMLEESTLLNLSVPGENPAAADLKKKKFPFEISLKKSGLKIEALRFSESVAETHAAVEGTNDDPPNPAIEGTFSSEMMNMKENFFLIRREAQNPHAFFTEIGPAHLELRTLGGAEAPAIRITRKNPDETFSVEIPEKIPAELPLGRSGLKIKHLRYTPNAKVAGQKIVNAPESVRFNPAVEFEVSDPEGRTESHTKFFIFPDFNSLRGGPKQNFFDLDVKLEVPSPALAADPPSPACVFYASPEGNWSYRITSSKGVTAEGPLKLNEAIETHWMDIQITPRKILNRARTLKTLEPIKNGTGNAALEIRLSDKAGPKIPEWILLDKPQTFETENGPLKISLTQGKINLPFSLTLKDFRKIDYPGTASAASFESDVALEDARENLKLEKTIRMNKPLDYKGYRIFQASYIQDAELGEASVFTIAKNPGIPLIYAGALIILVGVILLFYLHPFFTGKEKVLAAALLFLFATGFGFEATSLGDAKKIPLHHNGRVKPFDTFARQTLRLVTGGGRWQKKEAAEAMLDLLSDRRQIPETRFIRVDYPELKNTLGLPKEPAFFSLKEVYPSLNKVLSLVRSAKEKRDRDLRPTKLEQRAELLYSKVKTVEDLASGEGLSVSAARGAAGWSFSGEFPRLVEAAGPNAVNRQKIEAEVLYNSLKPFEWSAAFYFLAFLAFGVFKELKNSKIPGRVLLAAALAFHALGLALRIFVLSRPPVSNMYESMVYMNFALMIFAVLFFWIRRSRALFQSAAVISGLVMLYANLLPIDPGLEVLVPVLRSNYWLTIHVLTVVSSYGAFGLAMGLAHRHLFCDALGKFSKPEEEESADLIFRVIQLGTILIGTGTILGGVWANESWGRFWGWDPKETWAFITFLGSLVIVHLRFAKKLGNFALAVGSVLSFQLVLMTWYGVNFVLGRGLHSYGAGTGGMGWVIGYLLFEAAFLGFIFSRKSKRAL